MAPYCTTKSTAELVILANNSSVTQDVNIDVTLVQSMDNMDIMQQSGEAASNSRSAEAVLLQLQA